ncbi:MAG: InlB B-repeat-containing protein, partial [Propionibacteriaceae bacterium]|nr:InlB B-repeat-containing protein [Propionibacteriaceae bacterium]
NYYLNAKVFPHLTQHFYSSGRLNTLELLGLSVFGSQHGAAFNDDANTIAATFNDYQYNLKNTWSTGFGGSGAHLALEGYFRQGIGASTTSIGDEESAYTASDAVREANAIRTWRVTSKVRNINASGEFCPDPDDHPGAVANHHNGGTLATGNEAVFDLEVTRPTITTVSTGQGRTATYEAGKSNFTNVIGAGAVTISDAGVKKQVNADGDLEFIGTEDAADRTVVLVRYVPATGTPTAWGSITAVGTDTAPGKYNLGSASDTANLAAYLATLNHGDTVELLYTYAAADADPSLVGELPGDGGSLTAAAEKELGAYATPLLKTITIAETWTLYYDANIPSDATDAVPPIQMPANQTGIPLNTASAALGSPTGVPVKAHGTYTFAGWSNTAGDSATVDYSATATITSDNDKAVHAVWTWTADPSYTVTYHANYPAAATAGAGQVPIDEQHYAGETVSVTVIDPGVPTRAGGTYIFLGWSTDKDAGSAMYTSALRILTMPLHDVELYAIWQWNPLYTETEHTVRFWNDSVELTGTYAKQTVKDGSLAVNPGALPNTETRTFEGWVYNGVLFDFNTPITHDYDLVAKWSVQSYVPTPTPSESEKPQATPSASDEPEDEPDDDDDDLAYTGTQDPSGPLGLAGIVVLLGTAAIAIRRRP